MSADSVLARTHCNASQSSDLFHRSRIELFLEQDDLGTGDTVCCDRGLDSLLEKLEKEAGDV